MGHIGNKFLPLVFALLQRYGHVVEGQSQFFHFHTAVLINFNAGIQFSVAKGCGCFGKLTQGPCFSSGKGHNANHGNQYYKHGHRQKNIGDLIQNLTSAGCWCGNDDDAKTLLTADDGCGYDKPFLFVKISDSAGGAVASALVNLVKKILIDLPAVMVSAAQIAGA